MNEKKRRADLDAVTIGQIRKRYTATLDAQIDTLCKLIKQSYFNLPKAESYLKDAIAPTLTALQNLDAMASTEALFPDKSKP